MPASRNRLSCFLSDSRLSYDPAFHSRSNFYREEFIKCQRCLDQQREFYSERTITDIERALRKILADLDHLCTNDDADRVVSRLLQQFDLITGVSSWADPQHIH